MISLKTHSSKQTKVIARLLAQEILYAKALTNGHMRIKNALTLALSGNLGSGKTTFVQGFMIGAGIRKKITSPTFVLVKKYEIRNPKSQTNSKFKIQNYKHIYHIDCYRLHKAKELIGLGLKEILENPQNVVLIEWPEKIKKYLPKNTIWIKFEYGRKENERLIRIYKCCEPNE